MMTEDLWGELPKPTRNESPYSIIKRQADVLTEKTDQDLLGDVKIKRNADTIEIHMYIIAPLLEYYSVRIVEAMQPANLYPVRISAPYERRGGIECKDADELRDTLSEILQSNATKDVIRGLLSTVRDM